MTCDDACFAQRTADLVAALAWGEGVDRRLDAIEVALEDPAPPARVPGIPRSPADHGWNVVVEGAASRFRVSLPPTGVTGAVRVESDGVVRELPLHARICEGSVGGELLVTTEGDGCATLVVRALPELEVVRSEPLAFRPIRVQAGSEGWLAVSQDGEAAWSHSAGEWRGRADPHATLVGAALWSAGALTFPTGARQELAGDCHAGPGQVRCVDEAGAVSRWVTEPPPDRDERWFSAGLRFPPDATRLVTVRGAPGARVALGRRLRHRGWAGVRDVRLDRTGTAELQLASGPVWGVAPEGGRYLDVPASGLSMTVEVPEGASPTREPEVGHCRWIAEARTLWRGPCARLGRADPAYDAAPYDVVETGRGRELHLRPWARVPALVEARWDGVGELELDVDQVSASRPGPVTLVRSWPERRCLEVDLRLDGSGSPVERACPLPMRPLRIVDRGGGPVERGLVGWSDPLTHASVRVPAAGVTEVPAGLEVTVDDRVVDGPVVVTPLAPRGVVRGPFASEGRWHRVRDDCGPPDVLEIGADGIATSGPPSGVTVARRRTHGLELDVRGHAAWFVPVADGRALLLERDCADVYVRDEVAVGASPGSIAATAWSVGPRVFDGLDVADVLGGRVVPPDLVPGEAVDAPLAGRWQVDDGRELVLGDGVDATVVLAAPDRGVWFDAGVVRLVVRDPR